MLHLLRHLHPDCLKYHILHLRDGINDYLTQTGEVLENTELNTENLVFELEAGLLVKDGNRIFKVDHIRPDENSSAYNLIEILTNLGETDNFPAIRLIIKGGAHPDFKFFTSLKEINELEARELLYDAGVDVTNPYLSLLLAKEEKKRQGETHNMKQDPEKRRIFSELTAYTMVESYYPINYHSKALTKAHNLIIQDYFGCSDLEIKFLQRCIEQRIIEYGLSSGVYSESAYNRLVEMSNVLKSVKAYNGRISTETEKAIKKTNSLDEIKRILDINW